VLMLILVAGFDGIAMSGISFLPQRKTSAAGRWGDDSRRREDTSLCKGMR
jgi:hypothetical protein